MKRKLVAGLVSLGLAGAVMLGGAASASAATLYRTTCSSTMCWSQISHDDGNTWAITKVWYIRSAPKA